MPKARFRRRSIFAVLIIASVVVSGCSSSSRGSSSPGTGQGSGTNSGTSGKPVVLGLVGEENTPGLSFPDAQKAAKIAALSVNAAGGIKGRPVQIDFCNTQNTPQQASLCAEKVLGQDGAVMIAGGSTVTQTAPLFESAKQHGTFLLGQLPFSNQDLTSDISFPILPGALGYQAINSLLPEGTNSIAIPYYPSPSTTENMNRILAKLPSNVKTTQIEIPFTAATFQSYCLKAKESGAQAVVALIASGALSGMAAACQQIGYSPTWLIATNSLNPSVVQVFSDRKIPNKIVVDYSAAVLSDFLKDIAKYGSTVGGVTDIYDDTTITAWLSVKAAAKILNASKEVTGASTLEYLRTPSGGLNIGLSTPLDWTKPGPISGAPRMVLRQVGSGTIANGKLEVGTDVLKI